MSHWDLEKKDEELRAVVEGAMAENLRTRGLQQLLRKAPSWAKFLVASGGVLHTDASWQWADLPPVMTANGWVWQGGVVNVITTREQDWPWHPQPSTLQAFELLGDGGGVAKDYDIPWRGEGVTPKAQFPGLNEKLKAVANFAPAWAHYLVAETHGWYWQEDSHSQGAARSLRHGRSSALSLEECPCDVSDLPGLPCVFSLAEIRGAKRVGLNTLTPVFTEVDGFDLQRFTALFDSTVEELRKLATVKGGEYAGSEDRLGNFKRGAINSGCTAPQVLLIYLSKHYDSICTYVRDHAAGTDRPRSEGMTGRCDDLALYSILMKAMIIEIEERKVAGPQ